MPLDPETVQAIIASAVKDQERRKATTKLGPVTKLACTCGGVLHERVLPTPPDFPPPKNLSKRRRVKKKQLKRWVEETRFARAVATLLHCARPPGYVCGTCFRHMGFYEAIGRNTFKVEPLPLGALPIYGRDLDVASVLGVDRDGGG